MTLSRTFFTSLTAAAVSLAAACGGGDGNTKTVDPPLVCSDPGTGEQTWKLASLVLPTGEENPPIGFNLDDHNTQTEDDPVGCGHVDGPGGVDNQLGGLLGILGGFLGDEDLDAMIGEAIDSGDIDVTAVVTGYDGPGDDEVLISLFVNGEPVEGVQGICGGVNPNGDIIAALPSLPIAIPAIEIDDGVELDLTLDLANVRIEITNPSANNPAPSIIGGGVLWDDGDGNGLGPQIQPLVDDLLGDVDIGPIVEGFLDLGEPGACDSISLGVTATFSLDD